jgi:thiamine thiazole synthase
MKEKLSVGGGMWGGGMLFKRIVVQEDAKRLLDELECELFPIKEAGYYSASSVESVKHYNQQSS